MIMLQYSAFAEYLPTHRKPDDKFIVWTDDVAQAQSAQIALYDEETEQFVTPDTRRPIENVLLWAEVPTVGSLLFNKQKEEKMTIYFEYLYRYASNDKLRGSIGFHALGGITLEEAERRLKAVWPNGQFNPQWTDIPVLDISNGYQHEFIGFCVWPALQNTDLPLTLRDFVEQAERAAVLTGRRYQFDLSMENGTDETLNALPSKITLRLTGAEIEWVLEQMALVEKSVNEETGNLIIREIVVRPPAEQIHALFPSLPNDVFAQLVIEAGYAYIRAHPFLSCAADGETISVTSEELRQALTKGDDIPAPVSVDAGFADPSFPTRDEIIEYAKKYVGDKPWPEDDWVQGSRFALNIWLRDGQKRITYYTLEANDEIDTSKGVGFVVP